MEILHGARFSVPPAWDHHLQQLLNIKEKETRSQTHLGPERNSKAVYGYVECRKTAGRPSDLWVSLHLSFQVSCLGVSPFYYTPDMSAKASQIYKASSAGPQHYRKEALTLSILKLLR